MSATPAKDESDYLTVTIVAQLYDRSYRISKSILAKESGFFKKMFQHDWREVQAGVIYLHDDEERQLSIILIALMGADAGEDPLGLIAKQLRFWAFDDGEGHVDGELAFIDCLKIIHLADKYDMPAIQSHCIKSALPEIVEIWFGPNYDSDRFYEGEQQDDFVDLFLRTTVKLFGDVPNFLYDAYCQFACLFLKGYGHADAFIESSLDHPDLLRHLLHYFVDKLGDDLRPLANLTKQASTTVYMLNDKSRAATKDVEEQKQT